MPCPPHLFDSCRNMKGMEYVLLHVMEPILYVIRKNFRQGPDTCEPEDDAQHCE